MKNALKVFGIIAIFAIIGFSFAACGDGGGTTDVPVTGVTLNQSSISLTVGKSATLTPTVEPKNATNKAVTWSTSDETKATVANGVVTAVAAGSATITVTTKDGGKTDTCAVTVTGGSSGIPDLSGNITISPSTNVNINTELTATYSGSETVSYQCKKGGANVGTNSNKYTPTEVGSYTVTVSASGYNPKTSAVVDVNDPSLSTLSGTITISPNSGVTINTQLTATYSGSETVNYQWEKDGSGVGTNSNKYTPTTAGSYTVTVSLAGYNSKTSNTVTVTGGSSVTPDLAGNITISPSTGVTVNTQLTATYSGSETVSYQWKKGDTNVGTDSNKFTPTTAGSYTVTVSASGYNSKTSAVVDVNDSSLSTLSGTITISPSTGVTVNTQLTANYSGSETVNYQWKKGDTNVGTNSNKFTPTEAGSYTVTVSASGYNSKTSAAVTVTGGGGSTSVNTFTSKV